MVAIVIVEEGKGGGRRAGHFCITVRPQLKVRLPVMKASGRRFIVVRAVSVASASGTYRASSLVTLDFSK